jgi:hypothetical protein
MVYTSSNYEYLDAYMDDILTRSNDPMTVIKSLERPKSSSVWAFQKSIYVEIWNSLEKHERIRLKQFKKSFPILRQFQRGELSFVPHNLINTCNLLRIIQIGWNSIMMLVKIPKDLPPENGPKVR